MIERIAYETKSYGIELPDGSELLLPERNDEIYEKFNSLEAQRQAGRSMRIIRRYLSCCSGVTALRRLRRRVKKRALTILPGCM